MDKITIRVIYYMSILDFSFNKENRRKRAV